MNYLYVSIFSMIFVMLYLVLKSFFYVFENLRKGNNKFFNLQTFYIISFGKRDQK